GLKNQLPNAVQFYEIHRFGRESNVTGEETDNYFIKFCSMYLTNPKYRYVFNEVLFDFIVSGSLDSSLYRKSLEAHARELPRHVVVYRRLVTVDYRKLDDEVFEALYAELQSYLEKGEFSLYDFPSIAQFLFHWSDLSLIPQDRKTLSELLHSSLGKSAKALTYNHIAEDRKST